MVFKKFLVNLLCKYKAELDSFDQIIANLSASRNSKIIKEQNLTDKGSFCVNKMWKLKEKLHMKKK